MRRSRISVKPNFRPGGRGVAAGDQASRAPADADNTLPPVAAEDAVGPSPSPQEILPVEKPAEAAGFENAPNSPAQKASADLSNGAPSSGTTTPAAVPQRRMRISATPKLSGPKATSTPRQSALMSRSTLSALPKEAPAQIPDPVLESSTSGSTAPIEVAKQAPKTHEPPSPCEPSTSGLLKSPVREKKSSRDSPPSPQPGQVPQQPPHEPEPLTDTPTSSSDMPSAQVKVSRLEPGSPQKGTGMSLDREKILRALKLKELMKIERRKDAQKGKRRGRRKSEYTPSDRSKMTMRDLIYYLPDTSPMRGSTVNEEDRDETIVPLSPKMPEKTPEQEEEEEVDDESEEEDMLVPKVRVAEDGSIILDEESLTVRVQRASKTKVVESTALYERGFASTYSSYRNVNHVKSWSVRETDMFFLAISMVGTDFSLIGQLLPHRSRREIKNKFKKEEKTNSWRIDKAFRNKRPYDREFFSFLLEKVLAKDKEKGKSVKLVMTNPKRRGKARGKKAKDDEEECLSESGADEDLDIEDDGGCVDAEKENEGLPNVNKAEKKRKRKSEVKDKEDSCEEQGKRKKRKRARKTKTGKEMHVPEGDAEGECGLFNADCDTVNANKEDEHGSSVPAPKKKRRCSKKAEDNNEVFVEGSKGKRHRKSLKVREKPEDSIGDNEENAVEDDTGAAIKKRKRSREGDPKGSKQTKEAKSTKRKRSRRKKGIVEDEGTAEDEEASAAAEIGEASITAEVGEASVTAEVGEASVTAEVGEASEAKKLDTPDPAELMGKGSRRSARKPKRAVPNLTTKRQKKTSEPEPTDDGIQEGQYENNTAFTLEGRIIHSETEQVQKQEVGVLERTPPRVKNPLSPFEVQQESGESVSSMNLPVSPAVSESSSGQKTRMQRAERVKRSLTAKKNKKGKTKATFNQDDTEHDPETSTGDIKSPTVLLEQMVIQESEETEAGNSLGEDLNDLSCLDHLHSQTFQRRPMVVLSHEEVDMVLNVEDETSEEDPSVSPLDLSLNTELSFQLQCSNILAENTEADHVETDENGDGPQDLSSSIALEQHFEDVGLNEPVLGQFISTPTNISSLKSSEGRSQGSEVATSSSVRKPEPQICSSTDQYMTTTANEPEVSPPLTPDTASEHPVYTNSDAPVTDEAVIIPFPDVVARDALLASRGVVEDSKTSLPEEGREGSRWPLLASPEVMVRSLDSVTATPENEGRVQESILATQAIKEASQGSTVPTPKIKEAVIEGMQGSVLATPETKEGSKGFVVAKPEIKVGSHGSVLTTLELREGPEGSTVTVPPVKEYSQEKDMPGSLVTPAVVKTSKKTVVVTPEMKESSQGSIVGTPVIKDMPESSLVAAPLAKEDSQEGDLLGSVLAPSDILERSKKSVVVTPEIKESSQGSIVGTPVIKDGKEGSVVAAPLDKEFFQEEDLPGSLLTPSEDVKRSKKSLEVTPEIKKSSQGSIVGTPEIKDRPETSVVVAAPLAKEYSQEEDSLGSVLASSAVVERSKTPVVVTPEIKESSQGSIAGTPVIKDGKEGSVLVGRLAKQYSQEEDLLESVPAPSGILERSKKSVVATPEIKKSSLGSIVGTPEIKDIPESSVVVAAPLTKEDSQKEELLGSVLASSAVVERSKTPVVVTPEIKESSQGSIAGTPVIKDGKEGLVLVGRLAKQYSQEEDLLESVPAPPGILERSKKSVVITPEIRESSLGSIVGTPEIKDRPESSLVAAPLAKEDSQEEDLLEAVLAPSDMMERSKKPVVVTPEIKESSQGSIVGTPVIKDGKEGSMVAAPLDKEFFQEEDLPGSLLTPSEDVKRSKKSVVVTPEIKSSQGSFVGTPEIKDIPESSVVVAAPLAKEDSQKEELLGSMLASSAVVERLKTPIVVTPEIKESSQGSITGTPVIKDGKEGPVLVGRLAKQYSQEEDLLESVPAPSGILDRPKKSVVATPEIKESSQGSIVGTSKIKDIPESSVVVAAPLAKEDSQEEDSLGSMLVPSDISERSTKPVVATPEISQGSMVGTQEIKNRPAGSVVAAPLAKKNSQEEAKQTIIPSSTILSSGASVSSEHGLTLKRRSRFLKPKPNLSGASKIKNAEPRKKKIIPQSTDKDQHCEDSSMERFCRDEEKSCAVDLKSESLNSSLVLGPTPPAEVSVECSENQAVNVASCASPVVPEQERIISVSLSAVSTEESHLASEQTSNTCDVDVRTSSCASVSEDLQMVNPSCSWPLTTQTAEQERIGDVNFEEICAPARIIQPAGDGNSEDEPTFVLTLYEIPVTDAHLSSASNETVVASPFLISDQHPLPSVTDCPRDSLSMETGDVKKDCVGISLNESSGTFGKEEESDGKLSSLEEKTVPGPGGEHDQQTLAKSKPLHNITTQAKDDAKEVSPNLQSTESESECKDGPQSLLLEDLKLRDQSTPFTFKVSKCVASMLQDSEDAEQCEGVSHMVLADIFVPVSEAGDDLSKDSSLCEELTKEEYSTAESKPSFTDTQESKKTQSLSEEKKAPARRRGKLQPKLVHRASGKKDPSKNPSQAVLPTSQQSVVPRATRALSKKQEMEDISEAPKLQIIPKAKESSVLDPDLQQKHQMTPCTVTLSKCVGSMHQDSCVVAASEERVDVCMEPAAPEEKAAGPPGHKDTSSMTPTSSQEVKMPRRRAKIQVKPILQKRTTTKNQRPRVPQCNLEATESDSSHTTSLGSQEPELEKEDAEISTTRITGDDTIKCEMVSNTEVQESSLSEAHEKANLQPSHESNPFSEIMSASCSDSSPVDLDEDKEDREGVSHMVLTDIFVPVSDEMGDDVSQDFFTPIESGPHKEEVSPPMKQEVHLEKICKKEKPEKSKKSERPTKEKKRKQQVKRTCAKKLSKSSCQELETVRALGCPEVEPAAGAEGSSDLVNLKEKFKRKHQIMPCTVQVSRCTDFLPVEESEDVSRGVLIDTIVPVSEEVRDDVSKDCMKDKKAITSPLFTPSKGSEEQPVLEEIKSEESPAMMQKKCPSRKKGKLLVKFPLPKRAVKKTEASKTDPPVSEDRALNLPHTVSQTRQLPITARAKRKSVQSGSKPEAEDLSKASQSEPSLKESSPLVPTANKDSESAGQTSARSTQPSTSSGETEKSRADVPHITSVPASQDPGEVGSEADSSTEKESKEEASLRQMKKSFARHGAKPPVKPRLSKRTRSKEEDNSQNDKPLSSRLTSPTRRRTEAARVKEEPDQLPKKQITVSNTSRMETNSECEENSVPASVPQSPRHSADQPKMVLPRVRVQTTETGSCFDSSSPTSTPVRVSTSTSQPMTAPQRSKSPVITSNQSGSPESSEDPEDEPTRVSQFIIFDIFTEVEDGD